MTTPTLPPSRLDSARAFGAPELGTPEVHVSVSVYGESLDADGDHPVRVTVDRVATAEGFAPGIDLDVHDDTPARDGAAPIMRVESGARAATIRFASGAGVRSALALLVAAVAEAERRGLLDGVERGA